MTALVINWLTWIVNLKFENWVLNDIGCTEAKIQLLLKKFPDSIVSSLIIHSWLTPEGRPVTKNLLQYPWIDMMVTGPLMLQLTFVKCQQRLVVYPGARTEERSWSLSLRLVYPVLHKPPGATITSWSAVQIRINFWLDGWALYLLWRLGQCTWVLKVSVLETGHTWYCSISGSDPLRQSYRLCHGYCRKTPTTNQPTTLGQMFIPSLMPKKVEVPK